MSNDVEFLAPSDKALGVHPGRFRRKYNFPFDSVPVGMSFLVKREEVKNINVLRTTANRFGIKLNRKFKVVDHWETGYEVFHTGPKDEADLPPLRRGWDSDAV